MTFESREVNHQLLPLLLRMYLNLEVSFVRDKQVGWCKVLISAV